MPANDLGASATRKIDIGDDCDRNGGGGGGGGGKGGGGGGGGGGHHVSHVCRGVDAGQKILRRDFISLLLWRLSGHPTQDTAYTHTRPRPACCAPRRVLLALRGRCDNTDI